jgi:ribosomal RNA-processing protein 36
MSAERQARRRKQPTSDDNLRPDGMDEDETEVHESEDDQDREAKYAQYLESNEDDDDDDSESDEEDSGRGTSAKAVDLEESLLRQRVESVPFSSLLRAKKSLQESDSAPEDSEEDEFEEERVLRGQGKEMPKKPYQELEKRSNKHAPTEMTSRKPVSRRRPVLETQKISSRRDPRFSSLSASLPNSGLYQSSYGFLREKQRSEVTELKSVYNKLKRQEANHAGPKAKSEVAQSIRKEKEEVELALRRAEGRENERRKREREAEVITRERKAIQERVKEGGKQFYLKDSAKKQLILEDKFERLAGGRERSDKDPSSRKDLKRAIERRRKKNAAKERREMPLGGGSGGNFSSPSVHRLMNVPMRKRLAGAEELVENSKAKRKRGRRG